MFRHLATAAIATIAVAAASPAVAQRDLSAVEIKPVVIKPGIAVLFGEGGNIGVSYGDDATILIDDQYAPLSTRIMAAIEGLGADPVSFLVNTHWHFDHSGGNENFGEAGALIFAHDNVRTRMVAGGNILGNVIPPSPAIALPVVSYGQGITFHRNGDTIDVQFTGGGHTDGDSIVRWREDNVVHMGDLYFNTGGFPFIDTASGGSVLNALSSLDTALLLMDAETVVIPGHGPLSNKAELSAYRARLGNIVAAVRPLVANGMTLEQVIAAAPLANMGGDNVGFINAEQFTTVVYQSIKAHPAP